MLGSRSVQLVVVLCLLAFARPNKDNKTQHDAKDSAQKTEEIHHHESEVHSRSLREAVGRSHNNFISESFASEIGDNHHFIAPTFGKLSLRNPLDKIGGNILIRELEPEEYSETKLSLDALKSAAFAGNERKNSEGYKKDFAENGSSNSEKSAKRELEESDRSGFDNSWYSRKGSNHNRPAKRNFDEIDSVGFRGLGKRNFDEIDSAGFRGLGKRNFDEIDSAGFRGLGKRNFDEIDSVGFRGLGKRNFDEIDSAGFRGLGKRNFDEIDSAGFRGLGKRNFDEIDSMGFRSFGKRNFDEIDTSGFRHLGKRNFDELDGSGFRVLGKRSLVKRSKTEETKNKDKVI